MRARDREQEKDDETVKFSMQKILDQIIKII